MPISEELLVDVTSLHSVDERVGACDEHLLRLVLIPEVVLVEAEHVQLRKLQDTASDVEGALDERLEPPHLDTHQHFVEDFEVHAVACR